jgi:hypothetical protein
MLLYFEARHTENSWQSDSPVGSAQQLTMTMHSCHLAKPNISPCC